MGLKACDGARSAQAAAVAAFARSEVFARLFSHAVDLTDRAAAYLDGPGRKDAQRLRGQAAEAYAQASLSLSRRLQHLASWLFVYRAGAEAELSPNAALEERHGLMVETSPALDAGQALPSALLGLLGELDQVSAQVRRHELDLRSHPSQRSPHVLLQRRRLQRAFSPAPQAGGATPC